MNNMDTETTNSKKILKHEITIIVDCSEEEICAYSSSEGNLCSIANNSRTTESEQCPSQSVITQPPSAVDGEEVKHPCEGYIQENAEEKIQRSSEHTSEKPPSAVLKRNMPLVRQRKIQESIEESECPSEKVCEIPSNAVDEGHFSESIDDKKRLSCESVSSDEWSIYSV